jgi:hypothetical protein
MGIGDDGAETRVCSSCLHGQGVPLVRSLGPAVRWCWVISDIVFISSLWAMHALFTLFYCIFVVEPQALPLLS